MKHPKHFDTTPEISKRMSRIGLKRNKPERLIAKELWSRGHRYRLNYKKLPGSPDIAITRYRIAIFVDGEFWHGKNYAKDSVKSNSQYWNEKILENINRDTKNDQALRQMGWFPIHFWSNDVIKNVQYCVDEVEEIISAIKMDDYIGDINGNKK